MGEGEAAKGLMRRRWFESGAWGAVLVALYVATAALPAVLAGVLGEGGGPGLLEAGRAAGLTGLALLVLQVLLAGRFRSLDRPFGLDVVMGFHKAMALMAVGLLAAHPVLIFAGTEGQIQETWAVTLGLAALAALVAAVALALGFKTLGVPYQMWRRAHKGMLLVVVLGVIHARFIGTDFALVPAVRGVGYALAGLAVGVWVWRNVLVRLWFRHRFRVASVEKETRDTWTVRMEPVNGQGFTHRPGQFMFLTLKRPGRASEEHPFTIASAPTGEPPLVATIKESGDFTNTIGETREGDAALVEAPYGRFSHEYWDAEALLMVVGGVGITPMLSMLRAMRDRGDTRPVTLIWGNKTEEDIIRREEIEAMGDHVKVVHVLSKPGEGWEGETGRVAKEVLQRHAGDLLSRAQVLLCGPPPMMDAVQATLEELGVKGRQIHFERFAL